MSLQNLQELNTYDLYCNNLTANNLTFNSSNIETLTVNNLTANNLVSNQAIISTEAVNTSNIINATVDFLHLGSISPLSSYYAITAFTPTDLSGASLVFTNVTGYFSKIGNIVTIQFQLTYPTNSSSAQSVIGNLPYSFSSLIPQQNAPIYISGSPTYLVFFARGTAGNNNIYLYPTPYTGGGTTTNSGLSATTVWCSMTYLTDLNN